MCKGVLMLAYVRDVCLGLHVALQGRGWQEDSGKVGRWLNKMRPKGPLAELSGPMMYSLCA
jgi:hypothetical protein